MNLDLEVRANANIVSDRKDQPKGWPLVMMSSFTQPKSCGYERVLIIRHQLLFESNNSEYIYTYPKNPSAVRGQAIICFRFY